MEKMKFIPIGEGAGLISTTAADMLSTLGIVANELGFQHAVLNKLATRLTDPATEARQIASQRIGEESVTFLQHALSEALGTGKSILSEIITEHPELAGLEGKSFDGIYIGRRIGVGEGELPTLEVYLFNALVKMPELTVPLLPDVISAGPLLRMSPEKLHNRKRLGKKSIADIKQVLYELLLRFVDVEAVPNI